GFSHLADGKLVDGLTVLIDEVLALVDSLMRGGEERAAGGHVERDGARAVDLVPEVDEADLAFLTGLEQDCARAVAEEDAGGAVGVVDDGAHDVGADDENLFVRAGFDELGADLQGVGEAGAGGGEVKAPGAGGSELVLHEAGGG